MENLLPQQLMSILTISVTLSMVVMMLIQKLKKSYIIKSELQIVIANILSSLALEIPFSINFYNLSLIDSIWVSIFCFIGAPTIYEILKHQMILTYKPSGLEDSVTIQKSNEIKVNRKKQLINICSIRKM